MPKLAEHPQLKKHIERGRLRQERRGGEGFLELFRGGASNGIDCAELEKGQRVLIVADKPRAAMAQAYEEAAKEKGLDVRTVVNGSKENPLSIDTQEWKDLLDLVDEYKPHTHFFISETSSWPGRWDLYRRVTANGGFTYTSPSISHELVEQVLSGNRLEIQNRSKKIFDIIDKVREKEGTIKLTTGANSEYFCTLHKDSKVIADDMKPPKDEFIPGVKAGNLPGGEVETTDAKKVWGEVHFDVGSQFGDFGEVQTGITATFADSKLVDLVTHSEADEEIVKKMKEFMEKHSNNVLESIAIGTNHSIPTELNNTTLTREKVFGTIHIGVGDGDDHQDLVVKIRHLVAEGTELFKDGVPTQHILPEPVAD